MKNAICNKLPETSNQWTQSGDQSVIVLHKALIRFFFDTVLFATSCMVDFVDFTQIVTRGKEFSFSLT
jgi:hypothetical protein